MIINKIKNRISVTNVLDSIKLIISLPLALLYFFKNKNCWIICERKDHAEDNGWIFYHWVKQNKPNQKVFFVLDKCSKQFDSNDKNMVSWGSLKHFAIYVISNIHIKAIFQNPRPNNLVCEVFERITGKHIKYVNIRHGILKDGLEQHKYNVQKARLFICGAKPEYDYFLKEGGYPDGFVKYTGLARFDDLIDKKSDNKFILIIPTWRRYIETSDSPEQNEDNFIHSDYFKQYLSLLQNTKLINYIVSTNHRLFFCIHAEFRKYLHLFNNIDPRVVVVKDSSIHDLLMTTSLLITDYSSVFFDVAYMHKPIIYYQFDYEEFRCKHFSEGYFSYEKDGMGPVIKKEDDLLNTIKSFYDGKQFVNKQEYIERCNIFFPIRDKNNCERIFHSIKLIEN